MTTIFKTSNLFVGHNDDGRPLDVYGVYNPVDDSLVALWNPVKVPEPQLVGKYADELEYLERGEDGRSGWPTWRPVPRKIANLTQHQATPEQISSGVEDLHGLEHHALVRLLTFDELPTTNRVINSAREIVALIVGRGYRRAMIGGAPFLMEPLAHELRVHGIKPLFAFSSRESEETTLPDGSVKKVSVFRHKGFVEV